MLDQVRRKMLDYLSGGDDMAVDIESFSLSSGGEWSRQVFLGRAYDRRYYAWLHLWRIGSTPAKVHVALYSTGRPITRVEDALWRGWVILDGVSGKDVELSDLSKLSGQNLILHLTTPTGQSAVSGALEIVVV